jgi:hypothetical protein
LEQGHVYPAQYIEKSAVDETARFNEVRTGQADFTVVSALNYSAAKADSNLQVVSYQHQANYAAFMNNKVAPFYGMMLAPINYLSPDPSALLDAYILGTQNPRTKPPALVAMAEQAEQMSIGTSQRTAAMKAINADLTTKDIPWVSICQDHNIFAGSKKALGLSAIPIATISSAATFTNLQVAK